LKEYIYCSNRPWSLDAFLAGRPRMAGRWNVCISPDDLPIMAARVSPRYIFFPHWSYIVPAGLLERHECVCFHMTDVPYGRGGSPLQNLIAHGHKSTMLTALQMTDVLDAGPVYFKRPLSLEGSAEEIFRRASDLIVQMIAEIVEQESPPKPQEGEPITFARRKPSQSELPRDATPEALYDHIRMLDAPGYPHAFQRHGAWKASFTDARLIGNTVEARVRFERPEIEEGS